MTYDNLYIDLINLYYKMYYGLRSEEGSFRGHKFKKQGIRGTLRKLNFFIDDLLNDNGKVYLCIDNFSSRVRYRQEIDPTYKANRKAASEEFYNSFRLLCLILKNYNSDFIYCVGEGLEADDLLPYLIKQHPEGSTHLAISSDMDWARVITRQKKIVDWHNGYGVISPTMFEDKYGFFPDEDSIIAYKCFRGDASDNIKPGWPRLSEEVLLSFLEYGSIDDVIDAVDYMEGLTTKQRNKLRECIPALRKNKRLVSFLPTEGHNISCQRCKYNPTITNRIMYKIGLSACTIPEVEWQQKRLL